MLMDIVHSDIQAIKWMYHIHLFQSKLNVIFRSSIVHHHNLKLRIHIFFCSQFDDDDVKPLTHFSTVRIYPASVTTETSMGSEVLMAVIMRITVFWDVMLYCLIDVYQCFTGSTSLKMEAVHFSISLALTSRLVFRGCLFQISARTSAIMTEVHGFFLPNLLQLIFHPIVWWYIV